jgi:hypothetical protein
VPLQGLQSTCANVNGHLDAALLRYELSGLGRENHEMEGGPVNQSKSASELGVSPRVVLSGPDDWCQEQFELAQALVDAVTKVHIAMQNVENAGHQNIDRKPHALVLRDARIEARRVVAALDKYKRDHRYAHDSAAAHLGAC